MMKRVRIVSIIAAMLILLVSCKDNSWKGFYEEDLSRYLELCQYVGLTYVKPDTTVTDNEVDQRIALMLEASSELVEVDGKAAEGNTVRFDAYCIINGESSPSHSFENVSYKIGESYTDQVIIQLLHAIVGMEKGDGKEVSVTIPVDYLQKGDGELTAVYRITVLALYNKSIPKLTDGIASKLVAGCNTVAELKESIRARIETEKRGRAEETVRNQLKSKLIELSSVKQIPYSVYTSYYNDRIGLYQKLADSLSLSLEDYASSRLGLTLSELEALVSEAASRDTVEALVLYSIVKKEGISCTDEALYDYAAKMAQRSEGVYESADEYLSYYGENAVKNDFLWNEVLDFVMANAVEEVE